MKNTAFEFFANGTCKVDRPYLITLLEHFEHSLSPDAAALLARNSQLLYEEWCARWAEQFQRPDAFGPPLLRVLQAIQRLAQPENQPILEEALSHLPPGYDVKRSWPAWHQATALWVIARNTPGVTFPVVEEPDEREERDTCNLQPATPLPDQSQPIAPDDSLQSKTDTGSAGALAGGSPSHPANPVHPVSASSDPTPQSKTDIHSGTSPATQDGTNSPDLASAPQSKIENLDQSKIPTAPQSNIKIQTSKIRPSDFLPLEPWPEPVNVPELLDELAGVYGSIVVPPKWGPQTWSPFTVHTFCWGLRDVTVYLGIESPTRRCGKSTLLAAFRALVNRPAAATQVSPASVFRLVSATKPTLILDQTEKALTPNQLLYSIFNTSYTRPLAYVYRMAPRSKKPKHSDHKPYPFSAAFGPATLLSDSPPADAPRSDAPPAPPPLNPQLSTLNLPVQPATSSPTVYGLQSPVSPTPDGLDPDPLFDDPNSEFRRFSCWCPKIMAQIGHFDATLADRCILSTMQRKSPKQKCVRIRDIDTLTLKRKCIRWVLDHQHEIANARPTIPDELNDRAADIWDPLFVIADIAGGHWPRTIRQAAVALSQQAEEGTLLGALLLDLVATFVHFNTDRLFSRDLVAWLNALDDRSWKPLAKGRPVTEHWLAAQLREFQLRPRTLWINKVVAKGYLRDELIEVAHRYATKADLDVLLPPTSDDPPPSAPPAPPTFEI